MPSHYDIIEELTGEKPKKKGVSPVPPRDDKKSIIDNLVSRFGKLPPEVIGGYKGVQVPTPEAEAAPTPAAGPFSSLFDYEDAAKTELDRTEQAKGTQEKIARTNALGDALNLLVSSVGAGKGATVRPKGQNENIIKAMEKIQNLDETSKRRLDQFKMFDLNQKINDLKYQNTLEAAGAQREFATGERLAGQEFKTEQAAAAGEQDIREIEARGGQQRETDKSRVDLGFYDYRNPATKKAIVLNGVSIPPTVQSDMIRALQEKYADDILKPRVLKSIDNNEAIKLESVQDMFLEEWDYLNERVPGLGGSAPQVQQATSPTETAEPSASQGRVKRAERRAGADVKSITPDQYNQSIKNVADNPSMPYWKQLRAVKDIAILYNDWSEEQAEKYAKDVLRTK